MPYLNVDLDYFDHPQTVMLVALLGRGSEVLPIKLWKTCGKFFAEKGRLTGYSTDAVELSIGWWGDKGRAVKALMDPGVDYLGQEEDGTYYAKHWEQHNGHIHALKMRGRANAAKRWGNYAVSNATSIADSSPGSNAPAVQPALKAVRQELKTGRCTSCQRPRQDLREIKTGDGKPPEYHCGMCRGTAQS